MNSINNSFELNFDNSFKSNAFQAMSLRADSPQQSSVWHQIRRTSHTSPHPSIPSDPALNCRSNVQPLVYHCLKLCGHSTDSISVNTRDSESVIMWPVMEWSTVMSTFHRLRHTTEGCMSAGLQTMSIQSVIEFESIFLDRFLCDRCLTSQPLPDIQFKSTVLLVDIRLSRSRGLSDKSMVWQNFHKITDRRVYRTEH